MMTAVRRKMVLVLTMLLMLGFAALWSWQSMVERRAAAQLAADDLQLCENLAQKIEAMKGRVTVVTDEDSGVRQLGERLKLAQEHAQIRAEALQAVVPQAAKRMGDSSYLQKPTEVSLRRVTLQEVVAFFLHVTAESGLTVRDLRLQARREVEARSYWDVTVTLTYLVHSPVTKPRVVRP